LKIFVWIVVVWSDVHRSYVWWKMIQNGERWYSLHSELLPSRLGCSPEQFITVLCAKFWKPDLIRILLHPFSLCIESNGLIVFLSCMM